MAKDKGELSLGNGPGVGRIKIKELDEKAATYKSFRDRRQELTIKEVESKEALTDAMHKHEAKLGKDPAGAIRYVFPDDTTESGRSVVVVEPAGEQTKIKAYVDPGEPE